MRDFVQSLDDTLPGKFEITREGIVHDLTAPTKQHELTVLRLRKRLEKVMPEELVAHTGEPDVEDAAEGVMRRPDVMVIAEADMEGDGAFDPRTGSGAVFTDIHPTPAGPRYATRKDFVYGEEVTIAEWTIPTDGLPCYADDGTAY
ncbi:Uma2 family endonuclease [Streptomyces sp. SID2999]|uniref:Uma2 family endonuclease n=1 Tax=Streptomyces sp. SID2999 TaxID=2690258 RepID=UPI00136E43CB|nr:Uma2 family endonuclease [Streptomyces sp. SID2999]MYZ11135.1 Uma2 family endonuclease [Streptomyces sp. SID2999]